MRRGSSNVYADWSLADAVKLNIKTGLVIEIRIAIKNRGLTQQAAGLMGITQSKVSDMIRAGFSNLSERKLMDGLTRGLAYDIEIKVRPTKAGIGHLMLA